MREKLTNLEQIYDLDEIEEEINTLNKNNLENLEIKDKLLSALQVKYLIKFSENN